MMEDLPLIPDTDLSLYDEYEYIGKMYDLDIRSVYAAEINKVVRNPRDSQQYDTSNPCAVCRNTRHAFDECEILKYHDFLKIQCVQFFPRKKNLDQLQTDRSTESIYQINNTNETDVFYPDFLMGKE